MIDVEKLDPLEYITMSEDDLDYDYYFSSQDDFVDNAKKKKMTVKIDEISDNDIEFIEDPLNPNEARVVYRQKKCRRFLKMTVMILWFLVLILCTPIYLVYGLGILAHLCTSTAVQKLQNITFKLLATSLYITKGGKVVHKGAKLKVKKMKPALKEKNVVIGHSRSVCLPVYPLSHNSDNDDVAPSYHIHTLAVLRDNLNYLVVNIDSKESDILDAFLVDCSDDNFVWHFLKRKTKEYKMRIRIKAILLTHTHWDHCQGIEKLVKRLRKEHIDLYPEEDSIRVVASVLERGKNKFTNYHLGVDVLTESMTICGLNIDCIHCPGHTHGSVLFSLQASPNYLFSGDTLFCGGLGHNFDESMDTMRYSILLLCHHMKTTDFKLLPGHDYSDEQMACRLMKCIKGYRERIGTNYFVADATKLSGGNDNRNNNVYASAHSYHPAVIGNMGNSGHDTMLTSLMTTFTVSMKRASRKEPFVGTNLLQEICLNPTLFELSSDMTSFSEIMTYLSNIIKFEQQPNTKVCVVNTNTRQDNPNQRMDLMKNTYRKTCYPFFYEIPDYNRAESADTEVISLEMLTQTIKLLCTLPFPQQLLGMRDHLLAILDEAWSTKLDALSAKPSNVREHSSTRFETRKPSKTLDTKVSMKFQDILETTIRSSKSMENTTQSKAMNNSNDSSEDNIIMDESSVSAGLSTADVSVQLSSKDDRLHQLSELEEIDSGDASTRILLRPEHLLRGSKLIKTFMSVACPGNHKYFSLHEKLIDKMIVMMNTKRSLKRRHFLFYETFESSLCRSPLNGNPSMCSSTALQLWTNLVNFLSSHGHISKDVNNPGYGTAQRPIAIIGVELPLVIDWALLLDNTVINSEDSFRSR